MRELVAVITGASRGLGAELARSFWLAGYSLFLVARGEDQLRLVRESLGRRDGQYCKIYCCDLGDLSSLEALAHTITSTLEKVDVLINNAATHGPIGRVVDTDLEKWEFVFRVNLLAAVRLCQAVIPKMAEEGGGSIVNISGGGATSPRPNFSAYGASKAALVRFGETLAMETKDLGIRVNSISPGSMPTELLSEILKMGPSASGSKEFEDAKTVFASGGAPLNRVTDLALFLASKESSAITGRLISAMWDEWREWSSHIAELQTSDVYTLRRIVGRDRGFSWGDK